MLSIDAIRLHLPTEYSGRAANIARLVGGELGRLSWPGAANIPHLKLGPLMIAPGGSDAAVAQTIAVHIQASVAGRMR